MSSPALLLPFIATADSHLTTIAPSAALRSTAHLDFKIIIPNVLAVDLQRGIDRVPGAKTVAIMSNGRNVMLTATRSVNLPASNLILSAAARKVIAQDAACTLRFSERVVCTVSMP
jgi:hypothetical protein